MTKEIRLLLESMESRIQKIEAVMQLSGKEIPKEIDGDRLLKQRKISKAMKDISFYKHDDSYQWGWRQDSNRWIVSWDEWYVTLYLDHCSIKEIHFSQIPIEIFNNFVDKYLKHQMGEDDKYVPSRSLLE